MSRLERIRQRLQALERAGIVVDSHSYVVNEQRRWEIIPAGGVERDMSSTELETFMLGAESAQHVETDRRVNAEFDARVKMSS